MLRPRLIFTAIASLICASGLQAQSIDLDTLVHFEGVEPGDPEGSGSRAALILSDNYLYGTTEFGGQATGTGFGTVFRVNASTSVFEPLIQWQGTNDASKPAARLLLASDGNFYGTTTSGGADNRGTVFKRTPGGMVDIMYTFRTSTQKDTGAVPATALIEGGDGFLYGTTTAGGLGTYGTIYKILPGAPNTPIRLVDFSGTDSGTRRGSMPSSLVKAKDGNFYGVTESGGKYGYGTVFKLSSTGQFTTLSDFGNETDVYVGPKTPRAALIQASNGLLYGTSSSGGKFGKGTVFSVTTTGVYKVLINFSDQTGSFLGSTPEAPLIQATDGFLYGTTRLGGASQRGTVFRVSTGAAFKNLIQFTGGAPTYGGEPRAGLVQDNEGHLFGTTSTGGDNNFGTVFQVSNALPAKATAFTSTVTFTAGTRATLAGTINPQGTTATYGFEYESDAVFTTTQAYSKKTATASAGAGKAFVNKTTNIAGLTPSTKYHYRIVVLNGGGTTWGGDMTFTTGPNPNVEVPPQDTLVGAGQPAQFSVSAIGVALKYAWQKTGSATVLGTGSTYTIPKAATSHAGSYQVKVSDGPDAVQPPSARLGVISVAGKGIIVNEGIGNTIVLTLDSAGSGLTFKWKKGDDTVLNTSNGRIAGATTKELKILEPSIDDAGTYTCEVKLGSKTLNSGNFVVTVRLKPVMQVPNLGPWITNGQASGSVTAVNPSGGTLTYKDATLPAGVTLNPTTGVISGKPKAAGIYPVTFSATNVAGTSALEYNIVVLGSPASSVGTFAGITQRNTAANDDQGGGISFTISTAGTGTGKLTHKGKAYGFNLALSADPTDLRPLTITFPATPAGAPAVVATLVADSTTASEIGTISGTVAGAPFLAKRNPWNKLAAPVPAAMAGRFNLALNVAASQQGNAALPQGSGHGSLTVGLDGVAIWVGVLGDGTDLTTTTTTTLIAADGTVPLHKALYTTGTGSTQGWFSINGSSVLTESGGFDWLKNTQPANSTTRSYKTGFALVTLEADGGKYVKPSAGTNVLGLTGSTANAQIEFTEGALPSSITQVFNLPSTNVITFTGANPNAVTLKFDLTTGFFSGTFVVPDAVSANKRTVSYKGALIPSLQQGFGQFQLPQLPNPTTSATLSGMVHIKAAVAP